jgi:asparagine synthase (glutamine-hydrolysing)
MCRIAGLVHPDHPVAFLQNAVGEMCDLLKHGGPDDGGIFTSPDEHLVLGNRRLSLLDLTEAGHQPMNYKDRFTITYNGELYNYRTLKAELKTANMQFSNETDTEVILAAFAKWNTESFSKLNGMFAFALWDKQDKQLYLVRDAAGIKPLYYSTHTGGLAFASEIRAFAPVPYLQRRFENAAVYQLAYGYIPEPVTTIAHVHPVPKGCYIKYDARTAETALFSYSFFSFSNIIKNKDEAVSQTRNVTHDAVQRQMVADAQVGVFLSGGIDSAIIANLAENKERNNLHTLSIWFGEEKYSEKKYQDIIAKELKSRHHSIMLTEEDFHEHFPQILRDMDMPSCDGINTWFISKFAAEAGLKAVLSGIGADELFGGYPSFKRMKTTLLLQRLPATPLKITDNKRFKKWSRLSYLQIEGMRGVYLFLRGHFTPSEIAAQTGAYEKDIWKILNDLPPSQVLSCTGSQNAASWMEFNMYMQDQLLRDADVMSMAHGLEIRVPFLDYKVVNTVFSIDEKIKFGGIPKELLITSFQEKLPDEIWHRPKMGFSFPFAEWLKKSLFVKELAQSTNVNTRKACEEFSKGNLHWSHMISLIVMHKSKLLSI